MDLTRISTNQAILQSDIIWKSIGRNDCWAIFKRALTFVLIFIISLTLFLPANAFTMLAPLYKILEKSVENLSFLSQMLSTYFAPLMIILINNILMPTII